MDPATSPVISKKVKKCSLANPPVVISSAPLKMTNVMAPKMKRMMNEPKAPRQIAPFIANDRMSRMLRTYRISSHASFAKLFTLMMPVRVSCTMVFESAT